MTSLSFRRTCAIATGLVAALACPALGQRPRPSPAHPPSAAAAGVVAKAVNPCAFASESELKPFVASALVSVFPIDTTTVRLSAPRVSSLACAGGATIEVQVNVSFTAHTAAGASAGSGSFFVRSPLQARVSFTAFSASAPVTATALRQARLCLSDIKVQGIQLRNAPSWLDAAFLQGVLKRTLANPVCAIDITPLVSTYLAQGKTL